MPDWWSWTAWALGFLALAVLLPAVGLIVRRRWLATKGRVFDCSLRFTDASPGKGWMLGVARYHGDLFEWYRVFSWAVRPKVTLRRGGVVLVRVRRPDPVEATELYDGQVIADLTGIPRAISIAMARDDMTAFHSWTEAAPPGQGITL